MRAILRNVPTRTWVYLGLVLALLIWFMIYALKGESTISYSYPSGVPVIIGISIVEQDLPAISDKLTTAIDEGSAGSDAITSILFQASNPTAQIFLDYIFIPDSQDIPKDEICFRRMRTTNSDGSLTQLFSKNKALGSLLIDGNSYIYEFPADTCVQKGKRNLIPHVLLGIVPVESHGLFASIKGFQAVQSYPFDKQEIPLNIIVETNEFEPFSPSLQVVVAQKGWDGNIRVDTSAEPTLQLFRRGFYKSFFLAFFIIMILIIPFLNNVVPDAGGFFQIAFSLLLGLWGMHQILLPAYITSSTLVDMAIYFLYILVILEILETLVREALRIRVRITHLDAATYADEHVTVENASYLPMNLSGWVLRDKKGNQYKFPRVTLPGHDWRRGTNHTINVWTKNGDDTATNLHWGKDDCVWGTGANTAYLEDLKGEIISSRKT